MASPNEIEEEEARHSEEVKAEERAAIGARVVYRAIMREGEEELERPASALAWSGLAAGLSMGFSLMTQGLLQSFLPNAEWRPLVTKFGYCMGFLIVVLGRQQLFTENTLTAVLPFLQRRERGVFSSVMKLWGAVLVSNLVGALVFAWTIAHTSVFDAETRGAFGIIAGEEFGMPFGTVFLKAIFAGWLIALMVWLLPAAEAGKVHIIILITYLIGLGRLSHIIAGSVDTLYLTVMGIITPGQYLIGFFVPTLLGNIIGGVALVAALGHAQVESGTGHSLKDGKSRPL